MRIIISALHVEWRDIADCLNMAAHTLGIDRCANNRMGVIAL